MPTVEEIVVDALTRADRWLSDGYGGTRSVLYRRIGVRQRQLFERVAHENEDYFGVCADVDLDSTGAADLADIADPVPAPAALQRVRVLDPGESAWPRGTDIHLVSLGDPHASIAPRMTFRSAVLEAVGVDLYGVKSIRVSFTRTPRPYGAADGGALVELPASHTDLLVLDCERLILTQSLSADARAAALAEIAAEEQMLLDDFFASIRNFAPVESRFARPPAGVAAPASNKS